MGQQQKRNKNGYRHTQHTRLAYWHSISGHSTGLSNQIGMLDLYFGQAGHPSRVGLCPDLKTQLTYGGL